MKHLFIKAGGAGGRHVHLILRILPVVFLCYAVYLLLGMWLPFLFQPGVSKEFQRGFDKSGFYGTGSVDRAALIDDNVAALEIRIRMIEEAQKRLIFTNFDIRDCESGRDVAAALLAAAERGVQVQVLTDGMNGLVSMASSPVFYALGAHPNIEIRFYNTPNPLMPWTFNGRLHDKYILSDDRLLLAGGRNTFDKFLGDYVPDPEKSHDLDILFYNSAAGTADSGESVLHQVEQYFQMVWSDSHSKTWLESAPFFYRKSVLLETEALHMRHSTWREAHPELLKNLVKNHKAAQYQSFTEALIDLQNNRIDGLLIDRVYANYYLKEEGILQDYYVFPAGFDSESFAVGARKTDKQLVENINQAFKKLYQTGQFQKIADKWFGEDIAADEVKK